MKVCREMSIKEICEACERTTLYPEENCGCQTMITVCEVDTELMAERAVNAGR